MSAPLGPGDRLGPYRVVRRIGAGAMGTVHEAVEEVLGRSVAVKVIAPALADDPAFRARFTAEARAMAALDSPHVVQVHAYGEIGDVLYLATQLVPDGDLARVVREYGPLAPRLALDVVAQVAEGLAEAHRVGLLHRDITAANVLLRNRGEGWTAYLADFGLARRPGGAGDGAGTPAYLAPEVAAGGPSTVAADIYAVGCLLRLTLTGRPHGRPRAGRQVDRILARALAADPAARYADALALRDDLRVAADRQRLPSRRGAAAGAALVAVLAVLATGPLLGHPGPSPPAAGPALSAELRRAGLDPATARCVAARLRAGRGDPRSAGDVLDATVECLSSHASQVTGG